MMQSYLNPNSSEWRSLTKRPTATYKSLEPLVTSVFDSVKKQGDQSIIDYTAQFDGIRQDDFKVKTDEFEKANAAVPEGLKKAIQNAKANIASFHKAQLSDIPKSHATCTGNASSYSTFVILPSCSASITRLP